MEKEELRKLFRKYHEGTCTEDEKALLEAWYLEFNEQELDISTRKITAVRKKIFRELPGNHISLIKLGFRLAIAAGLIGLLISFIIKLTLPEAPNTDAVISRKIMPGGNRALLTLSDGRTIDLSTAVGGQIARQAGIQIFKTGSGQLAYRSTGVTITDDHATINSISTPKGGQWQVTLPDGSRIWLNSSSSLSYPTNFKNQSQRVVQLTGEGYFEIAKDKAHPFIVKTGDQSIKVLGTHFNINAYSDERAIKTTLAEGSIMVFAPNGKSQLLFPGQQSILQESGLSRKTVNVDDELAWTKGSFHFSDQSIQSIMRQLSRWYDIEVRYKGDIPHDGFNGRVSRAKDLEQVLNALEATQSVHFKVEGRRVIVMK